MKFHLYVSLFLILFLISFLWKGAGLKAQTNTWTGATDSDWHKTCNWSLNQVPICSHDVVIPTVATYPVITLLAHSLSLSITSAATDALTINSSGGARLDIASSGGSCSGTPDATFCCGASTLTINHSSGAVAPETKSVTYGIVATNLSGSDKCWITRNLGATNQASSGSDATDAAAGWYWQYNRKQGYKVGPTPAWTITFISENSDWLAAQDPCTIELGTGWRLPTMTELTNITATWSNYNDAYSSVLKMHAAGGLMDSDGSLYARGTDGQYWTSTQFDNFTGWVGFFDGSGSGGFPGTKAFGCPVRCIKD